MKNLLVAFSLLIGLASGAQNYALDLNGSSQTVGIGSPIPTGSSYTKEAWVYIIGGSNNNNILSSANSPFWITGAKLQAGQGGTYSYVIDPNNFPYDQWVHVAVTYDAPSTTMCLYRDGVLVASGNSAPAFTSQTTYIGSHNGSASFFRGRIDEVRIWNRARTQAQIKSTMFTVSPTSPGLVAYYPCNDGAGTTLTDVKGSFNGTAIGSPGFIASPVQGSASALAFDGVDDLVTIPDANSLDLTTALTIEAWVYPTKNSGVQDVVAKSSLSTTRGYIFPRTDDGWTNFCVYLYINGAWRVVSAPYPALNTWHHLAATYDATTIRIYLDGTEVANLAVTGNIPINANALAFGNQPGYNEYFGGYVDEIRIWNVVRTPAQIQDKMYAQLNDPPANTGLVAYYRMNQGIVGGNNAGLLTLIDKAGTNNGTLSGFTLNGAGSNYVAQNSLVTLPVNWENFTAFSRQDKAVLQWTTAGELNSKEFQIQRSQDAVNWQHIGTVAAAGNTSTVRTYKFEDLQPAKGANFYRILQVDVDGKSSYSEVKLLQFQSTIAAKFALLANPVNNKSIQLRILEPGQVLVFDRVGSLLCARQATPGLLAIDLPSQPAGTYFVKLGEQVEQVVVK